ncbi:MAG: hypothetical protein WCF57_05535 [Pyrinomonadaceae bacterium]
MSIYTVSVEFGKLCPARQNLRRRVGRPAAFLIFALFVLAVSGNSARAQNCDALVPSGGDDAVQIINCFNSVGHATLTANTFYIYQPIAAISFPNGVRLIGAGKNLTKIYPQFTCGDPRFVSGGAYKIPVEIRRSPNSVVSGFHLDLDQLRKDCGHGAQDAVMINKSGGSQVTNMKITGSQYGQPGYTTGWANGSGIRLVNSADCAVINNDIKDIGFSGGIASGQAIKVESSGNARVEANVVRRVSFGIEIVNGSPAIGNTGDSSGTVVNSNDLGGAAMIGCPDCAHGRGIKFQACGAGDEPPTKNVTVTNNTVANFGGQIGGQFANQGGSMLHLTCGVQYSRFENNVFIGAPVTLVGVLIDSSFNSPKSPTHHNTFNYNRFESGRGTSSCNGDCADVEFNSDGPDQIGLSRGSLGTNSVKAVPCGTGYCIRVRHTRGCSQYSHAWFNYPAGQNFVFRGQSIIVAAAGVRPPSFFSVVTYRFKNSAGVEVASFTSQRSLSNCVVNQQSFPISFSAFAPGLYQVFAQYYDGNSFDLFIQNDLIGTLDVR